MAEDRNEGIFGSLPRSRPGVRSPARDSRAAAAARPGPSRGPAASAAKEEREGDGGAPPGAAELESLARAGISAASQAASLGFRLAGRAAGALREAVERR